MLDYLMEASDNFDPLNNPLIDYSFKREINTGKDPKIQEFINKFPLKEDKGLIVYVEKISVLKNGEWSYDTYIKSNEDITKEIVIDYIKKLEGDDFDVQDISKEFYGGHPMGTELHDIQEIEGEDVWVVNLKTNIYSYMKKKGQVGNFEDIYSQIGGLPESVSKYISKDQIPKRSINSIIVDTINKMFFIDDNEDVKEEVKFEEDNRFLFEDTKQVHTHFDGETYYTFLNVFKDGKFLEKRKIMSLKNPINWKYVLSEILKINKNKMHYGFAYKLSYSWNKGYILETTDDIRYFVNYNCDN